LLVDPDSGAPSATNTAVAEVAHQHGVDLQLELTSCQVETATEPVHTTAELTEQVRGLRQVAADAARDCGAHLLAVGLPPTVPHRFPVTDTPRYRQIAERYGMLAHEQGICGCHVHVQVPDEDTAVQVCNRVRPWLPGLLALSANSAIYRNTDSGYASWRSVLWCRWPNTGPPPLLETASGYHSTLRRLQEMGAMLDDGMVYWDARPSAKFPTVEIRVADVPATVAETVVLATLARALVMTALGQIHCGVDEEQPIEPLLRADYWLAARHGMEGYDLAKLMDKVTPALHELGEFDYAQAELSRIAAQGNGAVRQRRAWRLRHDVADVLAEASRATLQ
jgi:glutamate---cysteine ligase / carboxylate-amine ligase